MTASRRQPVATAADLARSISDGRGDSLPSPLDVIDVVRRFASVEFLVPDTPESDGYLFQCGEVGWFSEPTFGYGFVRQLETVDSRGEHDHFIHVQFELRYPLDDPLREVCPTSDWWFPGEGVEFHAWLDRIAGNFPTQALLSRKPHAFEIFQEAV